MATIVKQHNTEQRLRVLEVDLELAVDALVDIWTGIVFPARHAKEALVSLSERTACPFCDGSGMVLCGRCKGGGTREHACFVCGNSGQVVCRECEGKGYL